ncbi:cytochrome P450 52A12 [Aspergillus nomiae NRRL 13137]|uniref:Cytochrome P450 52A12 n=1 Tax=Aspergillus nomiae NRRL (strain ATCC 15546 / NRRL 13137 / CBS 260.88 / M93) TaxID=1509407 RepID=A0A0L1JC66_ASPN3|nr:cytochrome P450 52A12 [Aspergillus nomiae NRRL 13137]KNG89322.1 cytochrome P450 52A12 [Aspergillus nomiae NRRL 13137]
MLGTVAPALAALYVGYFIFRSIQQRYDQRKYAKAHNCQLPPQADSGFFGVANYIRMKKAAENKRWVEYFADQYGSNGNTLQQIILGQRVITTIDPENIKALLAAQFNDFALGTRHEQFAPLLGDGIFTLDGAGWSHARGLLRPQFAREQVADLNLLHDHVTRLIGLIPKDGSDFDIQPLFYLLTLDSATHFLFGESVGSMDSQGSDCLVNSSVKDSEGFAEAFNTSQKWLSARARAVDLYWMINPKEFREANRRVHEVVDHYVRLALENRRHPEQKGNKRFIFAEALAEETDSPKVLRDNMLNILLAGRDTTASLLSSAFFFLSRHPHVWNKLRRVVIETFGDSQNPRDQITHSKLKDIPYLRHVLNEVLRLLPPVPLNSRVAVKNTTLPVGGGPDRQSPVFVAKGEVVIYSVFSMHRRTDYYGEDAETFRPERWEEDGRHGWEYLPFNGGPRICLGRKLDAYFQGLDHKIDTSTEQYALTEASYTLVRLMQHFDAVENADPLLVEPVIENNLTMSHGRGVKVRMHPI